MNTFTSIFRRAIFATSLGALLALFAFGWARAEAARSLEEVQQSLGTDLVRLLGNKFQGMQAAGAPSGMFVTLNGASLHLQTASIPKTEVSLEVLLDLLKEHCQTPASTGDVSTHEASTGDVSKVPGVRHPDDLLSSALSLFPTPDLLQSGPGLTRYFCLKARRVATVSNLLGSLSRFSKSGDIGEFGVPFSVEIQENGKSLSILSLQITGGLVPQKMFPPYKDCPGSDHQELPRPEGIRRVSAEFEGQPLLTSYSHFSKARLLLADYSVRLKQVGLHVLTPPAEKNGKIPLSRFVFTEGESFVVTAVDQEGESNLVVARLPH